MRLLQPHWFLTHHAVSIISNLLVLVLVASLLRQRRPAGSAIAWLLAIVLMPYFGIPLYLVLGGRKLKRRVQRKRQLDPNDAQRALGSRTPSTIQSVVWLDDGVLAYDTFLAEIRGAQRSIRIVTFVIGDDETGRSLVAALTERA